MFFSKSRSKEVDQINALIERVARLERHVYQHQIAMESLAKYIEADIAAPWMPSAKKLVEIIHDIPLIPKI